MTNSAQTQLRDRIFPPGPARDGLIVRAATVAGWESQLIGLGRLTAFVTPRLLRESHAVDDAALPLVFLQRHRVEIGLKLILERTKSQIPTTHRLIGVREACERACAAAGLVAEWTSLMGPQTEYVDLMDEADRDAATYRYPVDNALKPWSRESSVDLVELEAAGRAYQDAVLSLVEICAEREPLPVRAAEAQATVDELAALVATCRLLVARQELVTQTIREERKRIEALRFGAASQAPAASGDSVAAYGAGVDATLGLADRAERLLGRIVARSAAIRPASTPPPTLAPFPSLRAGSAEELRAQRDGHIKWWSGSVTGPMRALIMAVRAVEARSATWSPPAARQLHLEVSRFRSRLVLDVPAKGSWDQGAPSAVVRRPPPSMRRAQT